MVRHRYKRGRCWSCKKVRICRSISTDLSCMSCYLRSHYNGNKGRQALLWASHGSHPGMEREKVKTIKQPCLTCRHDRSVHHKDGGFCWQLGCDCKQFEAKL